MGFVDKTACLPIVPRSFQTPLPAGDVVTLKDPRLIIDVDGLGVDGWVFQDVVPQAEVTALLREGLADEDEGVVAHGDLDAKLKAYKVGDGLRLEGTARVELSRACGRCLQPAQVPVDLDVGMTLFPAGPPPRPKAAEEEAPKRGKKKGKSKPKEVLPPAEDVEDEGTATYRGGKADVAEILREALLLETPFSVLCRPDCKGLCQTCGADLNAGPCGCGGKAVDPRLAVLGKLKLG
jgi:uncharacterized protein